jgi:hypothetical protein
VVGGAVGLDGEHHLVGQRRVRRREVDEVAGHAELRGHRDADRGQPVAHVGLERVERRPRHRHGVERAAARLGVRQEGAQQAHPLGRGARRVHVGRRERADHGHPAPRPGDGHVEPALATVLQQRAEPVEQLAGGVLAVPDRQDDRVALVTLYPFEVFDEERLGGGLGEEAVQVGSRGEHLAQREVDAFGVGDAHRDHAERLARAQHGVLEDQLDDAVDLGPDTVYVVVL